MASTFILARLSHWIIKTRKRYNIHLGNRSHKKAWGKHKFTSRNFSFLRLIQQSRKLDQLNEAMDAVIDSEAVIVPLLEPPPENAARQKALIDMSS